MRTLKASEELQSYLKHKTLDETISFLHEDCEWTLKDVRLFLKESNILAELNEYSPAVTTTKPTGKRTLNETYIDEGKIKETAISFVKTLRYMTEKRTSKSSDPLLLSIVDVIDVAVSEGKNLFDFVSILASAGFKAEASTSPVGHVRIDGEGGDDILIYSRKYLEKGVRAELIGNYAIGREG
jgi:hypothetical protein